MLPRQYKRSQSIGDGGYGGEFNEWAGVLHGLIQQTHGAPEDRILDEVSQLQARGAPGCLPSASLSARSTSSSVRSSSSALSGATRSILRRASSAALAAAGKTILDHATRSPSSAVERRRQERSGLNVSYSHGGGSKGGGDKDDDDASMDTRSSFAGPSYGPCSSQSPCCPPSTSFRALRERALSERLTYESNDTHMPYTPRVYWSSMPS